MNRVHKHLRRVHRLLGLLALSIPAAHATELVYFPINPAFGGNPDNGFYLLSNATAQNKHKDPDAESNRFGFERESPLQTFNDSLERAILSRLAAVATSQVAGIDGTLQPGTVETGNFLIDIIDVGGGVLQITTTDKILGTSTSFQVGR